MKGHLHVPVSDTVLHVHENDNIVVIDDEVT